MDEQLVRNDRTYISTSLAADLTGYSQDYVGQLARDGHIESVKVGRKRFVQRDDVVSYALERKADLSVSDIPDAHVPQSYQKEPPERTGGNDNSQPDESETKRKGRVKSADSETQSDNQKADTDNSPDQPEADFTSATERESIVLPDEQMYASDQPSVTEQSPEQAASRTDAFGPSAGIADRPAKRWIKTRDGVRLKSEHSASQPKEYQSKTPAILAVLLALVVSFGVWVGPLSGADKTLGRMAHNISQASENAYYALGYGLDSQLKQYGPIGTVKQSLAETYRLATGQAQSKSHQTAKAHPSGQVAAAGSTANGTSANISSVMKAIGNSLSWLTAPIRSEDSSFGDYYQQPKSIVRATISSPTMPADQSRSNYPPEDTRIDQPDRGAVVVPAPSSTAARRAKRKQIRQQFSDPVKISASSSNSGIVQPQFGEREGDKYMYIMVPRPVK